MTPLVATLITGVILLGLGILLLSNSTTVIASLKRFPRSRRAAYVLFGIGAAWFLYAVAHLSQADFGEYRGYLFAAFAIIAILSFKSVPDFLAVRGLSVVILMSAMPLLDAGFMIFEPKQIVLYKIAVYLAIGMAIWLGAQPWRLRDWIAWMFTRPANSRLVGGGLLAYGLVLAAVAFTL